MASLTSAQRDQLSTLFITMFDAAPGATILGALVDAREAGASLADIAASLATKPQFKQLYPSVLSANDVSDRIADNLLPSGTQASAKTWAKNWIAEKLSGGESLASVLLQASDALTNTTNANFAYAKAQLANKLAVANYYSVTLLQSGATLAELHGILGQVTADPSSVNAAMSALETPLAAIKLGSGLDSVTLNAGASLYKGGDGFVAIEGLTLVDDWATIAKDIDRTKSDDLNLSVTGFVKTETTVSSLTLALTAAAADTHQNLVFHFGGNTYIYSDNGTSTNTLDDADLLVKLVGTVDLDLLVLTLA